MQYIFNLVLTTSIYASVVGIVIIIIKGILKNKLNAHWHYAIWIVLILKLMLPFGPESTISLFNAIPDVGNNNVSETGYNYVLLEDQDTPTDLPKVSENQIHSETAAVQKPVQRNLIPYIWALGAAEMLFWLIASYLILIKKLQQGICNSDQRIAAIKERCIDRMGIKRDIQVVIQETVRTPSLFGLVHPKILLSSKSAELNDKELEYILLHELAHYKRKDVLVNYLLLALQTVHWFNPVMWYLFKKIREDMEFAADEKVLSLLENSELKAYGRTLLTIIENFTAPRLAPRLLAMADDKKGIERRLKMIKMAELFKAKRRLVILIGLLCIALLSGILLTNAVTDEGNANKDIGAYDAAKLSKYRTENVGDNVKVVNIIKNLPYGENAEVSLQTKEKPYGIIVSYDFKNNAPNQQQMEEQFYNNAAVAFALIQNVDNVDFKLLPSGTKWTYTREKFGHMNVDLWSQSQDMGTFREFLENLVFQVHVTPLKYELTMSSTPGIRIMELYQGEGAVKTVRYSTETGVLSTWEPPAGKVQKGGSSIELPRGKGVYWSPLLENVSSEKDNENTVTVALLNQEGKEICSREVKIIRNGYSYEVLRGPGIFTEVPSQKPATIEEAVSNAILTKASVYRVGGISMYKDEYHPSYMITEKASTYKDGEILTEGHVILGTSEQKTVAGAATDKEGSVKTLNVYVAASAANFGYQDGIFTIVSESGAIPTVITLRLESDNTYTLLEYQEPKVSFYPVRDIKEMFPPKSLDQALNVKQYTDELKKQQERQAAEYLKRIGRKGAATAYSGKGKWPLDIEVEAINKIFFDRSKHDSLIDKCPYWAGTKEGLENGIRYIYKTADYKAEDGAYVVVLTKSKSDGTVVKQMKFHVKGSEVNQIE